MTAASESATTGFLRSKALTAHNGATMRTVVDFGEPGRITLDEPVPHGGTGQGPSPLQAVLGALCARATGRCGRTSRPSGCAPL
jgi:hypothetical protein